MYDGFRIISTDSLLYHNIDGLQNCTRNVQYDKETGLVWKTEGKFNMFFIKQIPPKKSSIRGSLHKYCDGDNCSLFTFRKVVRTCRDLANTLGCTPESLTIKELEIGINLPAKCPEAIIDSAMLFNGETFSEFKKDKGGYGRDKRSFYGKIWQFTDYTVKLYVKSKWRVRFEIKYLKLRKLGDRFQTLKDLMSRDNFVFSLEKLVEEASKLFFVPSKLDSVPLQQKAYLMSLRLSDTWDNLSKDQKYRAKRKVRDMIVRYNLINWETYVKKGIYQQGALMLNVSDDKLAAMISHIRLTATALAEDKIEGERVVKTETNSIGNTHHISREIKYIPINPPLSAICASRNEPKCNRLSQYRSGYMVVDVPRGPPIYVR